MRLGKRFLICQERIRNSNAFGRTIGFRVDDGDDVFFDGDHFIIACGDNVKFRFTKRNYRLRARCWGSRLRYQWCDVDMSFDTDKQIEPPWDVEETPRDLFIRWEWIKLKGDVI